MLLSLACMKYAYKLEDLHLAIYTHSAHKVRNAKFSVFCTIIQLDLN